MMNQRNGFSPAQPNGVGKDLGELTHDIVSLAELQLVLLRSDCRDGLRGLLIPLGLLLCAAAFAIGTAPVALLCFAEWLIATEGLSRPAALLVSGLAGSIAVVVFGLLGWFRIRSVSRVFKRSREEFVLNLNWIKHALKRPATANKASQNGASTNRGSTNRESNGESSQDRNRHFPSA